MKSLAFFSSRITEPYADPSDIVQNPLTAEVALNKDFSSVSYRGLFNEPPTPGYSLMLDWMDLGGNVGQVGLQVGFVLQHRVVCAVDWQTPSTTIKNSWLPDLPDWAWDALFKAGTKISFEVKTDPVARAMTYRAKVAAGANVWDSSELPFPAYFPPAVSECVFCGIEDAMTANFSGLDAGFKMSFGSAKDIQYGITTRAGGGVIPRLSAQPDPTTGEYKVVGQTANYRITIEDGNADQNDLFTGAWTFTQKA